MARWINSLRGNRAGRQSLVSGQGVGFAASKRHPVRAQERELRFPETLVFFWGKQLEFLGPGEHRMPRGLLPFTPSGLVKNFCLLHPRVLRVTELQGGTGAN